ncbi:MAG: Ribosome-binding factor [Candidatus Adlerbacteria bacterium]|nr:Ribosome-binding factor [Candidatus Adlerbacteria bacterium]
MQEAIRNAAADFLAREAGPQALITVTRAQMSSDGKSVNIMMTVLPDTAEEHAVSFANRHRADFTLFMREKVRGIRPPNIEFMIDMGEKNRQRLDDISLD